MTLSRYRVSREDPNAADPQSRELLVTFPGGSDLHTAGWIGFHPKTGHLYLTVEDGDGLVPGTGFAPVGKSQMPDLLRGKILRIELSNAGRRGFPATTHLFQAGDCRWCGRPAFGIRGARALIGRQAISGSGTSEGIIEKR